MSKFDSSAVYDGLKDFQQRTVDYVMQRFYHDDPPAKRFLVADEVGLGKTLVARGVIARAAEHLQGQGVDRVDVVYICSNTDIARQNIKRLSLPGFEDAAFSSRLTLLPLHARSLNRSRFNLVSFTPRTALDLKSNLGWALERVLLYWLLKRKWPSLVGTKKGPLRVFQRNVASLENFSREVKRQRWQLRLIDPELESAFSKAIDEHDRHRSGLGQPGIRHRLEDLASRWSHDRKRSWAEQSERNAFIGDLRNLLAKTCVRALKPDLVILDEFQRFRHLLDDGSEASELAHALFDYSDESRSARVLLLSATPYKMYTLTDESERDDHFSDFLGTTSFLMNWEEVGFGDDLARFGRELTRLDPDNLESLVESKSRVEAALRKVMCRTERLAFGEDRSGMLKEVEPAGVTLKADDLVRFVALDRTLAQLGAPQPLEYWKSAPYFANYWDGYQAGHLFSKVAATDPDLAGRLWRTLGEAQALLPWEEWRKYEKIDPGNARIRSVIADIHDRGMWKLLWIPPALPYYEPTGPYAEADVGRMTKRLIFSSWNVVPKAVSTLLSYETERRMMTARRRPNLENSPQGRERFTEPLRFPTKATTGMSAFAFVYPSPSLARLGDPLDLAGELGGSPNAEQVVGLAAERIMRELDSRMSRLIQSESGAADERWYWSAPLLLDADLASQEAWFSRRRPSEAWTGSEGRTGGAGFEAHLDRASEVDIRIRDGSLELGPMPENLDRTLALLAVAGPANVAYRAFGRIASRVAAGQSDEALRDAAATVAWGFRSLFNTPEVSQLVRGLHGEGPYWQRALNYCLSGNLQAVLDEYLYVLPEFQGVLGGVDEGSLAGIAQTISDVVSLRSSDLHAHDLNSPEAVRMRVRFALPFGQRQSDEEAHLRRAGFVRTAFNSPFWPFVLTTTSVGQEGLDFHLYCHAVVHWNLPSNPVDLEQREGRVHRYMGHAVRKNLVAAHGGAMADLGRNPWQTIVTAAISNRGDEHNDLYPFWVYPGPNQIERHVPRLPLSREEGRLPDLKRSLALYRLVFGQARQEELVEILKRRNLADDQLGLVLKGLMIDLAPADLKELEPT